MPTPDDHADTPRSTRRSLGRGPGASSAPGVARPADDPAPAPAAEEPPHGSGHDPGPLPEPPSRERESEAPAPEPSGVEPPSPAEEEPVAEQVPQHVPASGQEPAADESVEAAGPQPPGEGSAEQAPGQDGTAAAEQAPDGGTSGSGEPGSGTPGDEPPQDEASPDGDAPGPEEESGRETGERPAERTGEQPDGESGEQSAQEPEEDPQEEPDDGRFKVVLDNFEGPFDLLLQLISKHKMDVTEVALSKVTDEFMVHIRAMGPDWDLDQTTEFLVVAATLLDLKAARLLPSAEVEDEADLALLEARDLLFARLLQYRAYKEIANIFAGRMADEAHRHPRTVGLEPHHAELLPEVAISIGPEGFARLAVKAMQPKPKPQVYVEHIHAPLVSVREQAEVVVARLRELGEASFRQLIEDAPDTLTVVARFLALLELYRERAVSLDQEEALGLLTVRWSGEVGSKPLVTDEFDQESAPGQPEKSAQQEPPAEPEDAEQEDSPAQPEDAAQQEPPAQPDEQAGPEPQTQPEPEEEMQA